MEGLLLSEVEERNLNFRKREFDKEEQARRVYRRTCDDAATSEAHQSPSLFNHHLYQAINNHDVKGIANNVHRKDVGWKRNDWAERRARSIRF